MKRLSCAFALVLLSGLALAADNPDWAYPVTPPPGQHDSTTMLQVPNSTKQYTKAQIEDTFNPPDWYPDEHLPMPQWIVAMADRSPRAAPARNAI